MLPLKAQRRPKVMSLSVSSAPSDSSLWVDDGAAGPVAAGLPAAVVSSSVYLRKTNKQRYFFFFCFKNSWPRKSQQLIMYPQWSWLFFPSHRTLSKVLTLVWSAHVLTILGYYRFLKTASSVPGSGFGGGSLGLLLGVWTLQILMKPAISIMRAMPINSTAHQWA